MSPSAPQAATRWRLRAAAAAAGIAAALGGAQPSGRRIAVWAGGGAAADADRSARWRGRLLIEEAPARLDPALRRRLHAAAAAIAGDLGQAMRAEFAVDGDAIVLVDAAPEAAPPPTAGCAFAADVALGEPADPGPVRGVVTAIDLPGGPEPGARIDAPAWTPIGRVAAAGADRAAARAALAAALDRCRVDGVATTLHLLRAACVRLAAGPVAARDLDGLDYAPPLVQVVAGGLHTTVQDFPGRLGRWDVGVPPSGPMDDLAFRLANRLVGNPSDAAGLEITLAGPALRFHRAAVFCLAGPAWTATLDGVPVPLWRAVRAPAGAVLRLGGPQRGGVRLAMALRGGLRLAPYLGSRATFDLGGFGGHAGRPLAAGDWLELAAPDADLRDCPPPLPAALQPAYPREWTIGVLVGPHAAPEFLTAEGLAGLLAASWTVHHHSNRTGVRLVGPAPGWARGDGGEAGLHPSNIHDNAYAIGAIDLTGDMPILLGPDGPSCGGFVCPAVIAAAERWKMGQLRPGDRVRFAAIGDAEAARRERQQSELIAHLRQPRLPAAGRSDAGAILAEVPADGDRPRLVIRRAGDRYVLAEYGPATLDLGLRLRVGLLMAAVRREPRDGIIDVTPGVRSLQLHHAAGAQDRLVRLLIDCDRDLAAVAAVPSRTVTLPLSWDDPATREAIAIYMRSVRADAPWCPWNIEFIRRINGLADVEEVRRIVYDADYLVLGLGDVYLGAPVATPVDPRHRLVTTKYNPARTWTPENAVGIGGAYMCIYGMEGPGGYQFVGRTVPVWNAWRAAGAFAEAPWLLRQFDRIRFAPCSAGELLDLREDMRAGRWSPAIAAGVFDLAEHHRFCAAHAADIAAARGRQQRAYAEERARWAQAGRAIAGASP